MRVTQPRPSVWTIPAIVADRRLHYGLLALGFVAGLVLRLAVVSNPGNLNFTYWYSWATWTAKRDVIAVYHIVPTYGNQKFPVNYPPLTIYIMGILGKAYYTFVPGNERTVPAFYPFLHWPSIITDIVTTTALIWFTRWRKVDWRLALLAGLVYWLNPGVLEGTAITAYLDSWFGALMIIAFILIARDKPVWAAIFYTTAILTKPQPLFLLPLLVVWVWRTYGLRRLALAALASLITYVVLMLPYILNGEPLLPLSAVIGSYWTPGSVSARQFNVWWLVLWLTQGLTDPDGIVQGLFSNVVHLNGSMLPTDAMLGPFTFDRWMLVVLGFYVLGLLWRVVTWRPDVRVLFWAGALSLFGYCQIALQVHEYHLFGAIPLIAAVIIGSTWRGWLVFGVLSLTQFFNVFMFEGWGGENIPWSRIVGGFDTSVIVAFANVVLFVVATYWFMRGKLFAPPQTVRLREYLR